MNWIVYVRFKGEKVGIVRGKTRSKEEMRIRFGCNLVDPSHGFKEVRPNIFNFGGIHVVPESYARKLGKRLNWEEMKE